jgi:hypothetical protein
VVERPTGGWRIDWWMKGTGWTKAPEGALDLGDFMPGYTRPVSARDCARLGCSLSDLGPHWWEETASTADRKKLVRLLKERAWHLAGARCAPGRG